MAHLRILNYAINGNGAGDVYRQISVHRWLRRYADHAGHGLEALFLTSSETQPIDLSEAVASVSLPTTRAARRASVETRAHRAIAKQVVWQTVGSFHPDLLIVDGWPRGAFGELVSVFDLCRTSALLWGPELADLVDERELAAISRLFDTVILMGTDSPFGPADAGSVPSIVHVDSLGPRENIERLDRWEARERLGVFNRHARIVLVAFDGHDSGSREALLTCCAAVVDRPDTHIIAYCGAIGNGQMLAAPNVSWLSGSPSELLFGVDAAICDMKCHALADCLIAGTPVVAALDENSLPEASKHWRAMVCEASGELLDIGDLRTSNIEAALDRLPARTQAYGSAARRSDNGARRAAAALLCLVTDKNDVHSACDAIDDSVLRIDAELSIPVNATVRIARLLSGKTAPDKDAIAAAAILAEQLFLHILMPPYGFKLVVPLCETLPEGDAGPRGDALRAILDALACYEDWDQAIVFAAGLVRDPSASLSEYARALCRLLSRCGDYGLGLEDIAEALDAVRRRPSVDGEMAAMCVLTDTLCDSTPMQRPATADTGP
ncbi:MAG: hypothetical protein GC152_15050 [Alphaproteobacteria bacterium]|nr:hypothetical protein [Alphaproteobacteria bacterium]